jgi:hypothetical protein
LMASMSVVGWSSKTSQKLLITFSPFPRSPSYRRIYKLSLSRRDGHDRLPSRNSKPFNT